MIATGAMTSGKLANIRHPGYPPEWVVISRPPADNYLATWKAGGPDDWPQRVENPPNPATPARKRRLRLYLPIR